MRNCPVCRHRHTFSRELYADAAGDKCGKILQPAAEALSGWIRQRLPEPNAQNGATP